MLRQLGVGAALVFQVTTSLQKALVDHSIDEPGQTTRAKDDRISKLRHRELLLRCFLQSKKYIVLLKAHFSSRRHQRVDGAHNFCVGEQEAAPRRFMDV